MPYRYRSFLNARTLLQGLLRPAAVPLGLLASAMEPPKYLSIYLLAPVCRFADLRALIDYWLMVRTSKGPFDACKA